MGSDATRTQKLRLLRNLAGVNAILCTCSWAHWGERQSGDVLLTLIVASSDQISDPAGLPENHPLWVVCNREEGKNEFASFHLPFF